MKAKRRVAGAHAEGKGGPNSKWLLALLFVAIVLLSIVPTASADWHYRKPIEIDHNKIAADLADFPVLISITDSDLAARAQDNGDDIVFTDGTNSTRLDHEIEKFDGSTGELVAWVRIPSLSSTTNTTILMWYGNSECGSQQNPTGVWDSNYKMVQHLNESCSTANCILDSTSNDNDGTPYNSTTITNLYTSSGKMNGADDFDGSYDYVKVPETPSLDINETITMEAWVKTVEHDSVKILQKGDWDGHGIGQDNWKGWKGSVYIKDDKIYAVDWTQDGNRRPQLNTWYYIVLTYDGSKLRLYVDGQEEKNLSVTGSLKLNNRDVFISSDGGSKKFFNGTIDEVRISATARSGDWISTTYNNTHSPSTFYEVKDEQNCYPAQPVPDLPAVILFSVGLLVLAGYVCVVRRTRRK